MRTESKSKVQNSIGRAVITILSIGIQVWWISFLGEQLSDHSSVIQLLTSIAALIISIVIFSKDGIPIEFKTPFIMLILIFPVVGFVMILMLERSGTSRKMKRVFRRLREKNMDSFLQDEDTILQLENHDSRVANQFRYLSKTAGFPVYDDSEVEFYSEAEKALSVILSEVRNAEKFIFIDYYAIQDGIAFNELKYMLKKKVQDGIEVRIIYDDIGSIGFLNNSFKKKMEALGIKCKVFNKISPAFRLFMNHRNQ